MRAFPFCPEPSQASAGSPAAVPSGRRSVSALPALTVVLLLTLFAGGTLSAQRPGEIVGRVVDESGNPVPGATVTADGVGEVRTDASGAFRLRGLPDGSVTLHVRSLGYAPLRRVVQVEPMGVDRILLRLTPIPVALEGVEVTVDAHRSSSDRRIPEAEIRRSGAATLGDLLRGEPGMTVVDRGPGSPQFLRIRGSAPDAVLVLVDGVPLNDPVTGEADLSTLPAATLREVRVLPGARSAAHGPGARAGVVLVETRGPDGGGGVSAGAGSLGLRTAELEAGGGGFGGDWSAGVALREAEGRFTYERPPEVGGGAGVRENTDVTLLSARAAWDPSVPRGELRLRLSGERIERGLPGPGYAPSPRARQEVRRMRGSTAWTGDDQGRLLRASVWTGAQDVRHRDPAPPVGPSYDDRAVLVDAGARLGAEVDVSGPEPGAEARPGSGAWRWVPAERRVRAGIEVRVQDVDAGALLEGAPTTRGAGGVHAGTTLGFPGIPFRPRAAVALRLDRAPAGPWHTSHEIRISGAVRDLHLHLAHRSAFSPPTLGDQYFRQGVGVVPNADLRGERVRGEVEAGLSVAGRLGGGTASVGVTAHRGRVEDLILWLPDFRFVWSPRNVDVERHGVEAYAEGSIPLSGGSVIGLSASHAWSRVLHLRDRLRGIQLPYRPEHQSSMELTIAGDRGRVGVEARRLGSRYPRSAEVNRLPGFWELDLAASRRLDLGAWEVEPLLRLDRLLDRRESLIFGFPEPGRTLSVTVELRRPGPSSDRTTDPPP